MALDTTNMKGISSAFMILTEACSLKCRYCFVNQNPRQISLETAIKGAEYLYKNAIKNGSIPSIVFFGGEPMLRYDDIIVPLIRHIEKSLTEKRFDLSITTNGMHLTEERLEFFKNHNVNVMMSMDGAKSTQDWNRPTHRDKGSYDVLIEKIPMLLKYFPDTVFRATISNTMAHKTFENICFAIEQGFGSFFFIPDVFAIWTPQQVAELKEQMREFSILFIRNVRGGKILRLNPLLDKFMEVYDINSSIGHKRPNIESKCGLGLGEHGTITTDGTIIGCQQMSSYEDDDMFVIGDICNGEDMAKRINLARQFNQKNITSFKKCKTCLLQPICDGGCVANNYLINGDLASMPDMLCVWYQILLDEAIYIMNTLGEEENELFREFLEFELKTGWR